MPILTSIILIRRQPAIMALPGHLKPQMGLEDLPAFLQTRLSLLRLRY